MERERLSSECPDINLDLPLSREDTLVAKSSVQELVEDPLKSDVKGLLKKVDRNLMPIICVLYLLSCLDHSNLGNARENGIGKALHMTGKEDFNIAISIFFPAYLLVQVPSNLVLRAWRPSIWIPTLMLGWAIITTCTGMVQSFGGLLVSRVFLGLVQGGVFPGLVYFISMWYQSHECGLRIAMFYSVAVAGGSFNSLIGSCILHLKGIGGLDGWSWLFIIEGAVTFVAALSAYWFMQDYPETANFLASAERRLVLRRIDEEQSSMPKEFRFKYIKDALLDWKIWIHMIITLGITVPMSSISEFLPGIIDDLGYQGAHAKLMTIPPHIAGCLFILGGGIAADRHSQRGLYIICFCIVGIVGFIMLGATNSLTIEYMSSFLIAIGTYPIVPQDVAWNANNIGGSTKRAVGIAMHIGFGNLGGAVAGFIIRRQDARRFVSGHGVLLGMMGMSCVLTVFMTWYLRRENKSRASRQYPRWSTVQERLGERERGDRASYFRYTI
ncbi:major facilitator superfamily transporter [Pochonia chlamydosporia 170]|uniref:Major facilitator superfamily transporter n=1 Tax=Pochonia chlamydosporia 170 TaxID=1380566 RepID=A0A179G0L3_METCM|nr:major facilitator superfamily transporter [Pochonia chlamydosporia 170]OAQ70990.1 major facilitator superfamily transporter [Pochonia chlamydosporia 170]